MTYKIFLMFMMLTSAAFAQSNTFPANGNVGIGTTSPEQQLTVKGGIGFDHNAADKKLFSSVDGTLEWSTHNLSSEHGFAVSHQGTRAIYLNTAGDSYFTGGNLGIGINVPVAKLDIRGDVYRSNVGYGVIYPTLNIFSNEQPAMGVGAVIALGGKTGLTTPEYGFAYLLGGKENNSSYAGYFAINTVSDGINSDEMYSANYERFRIASNGNVGIGTTSPREKLSVNGHIRAKEIKVETSGWPDYVFEEGYDVGNLKALESYIKANKRLPDMPTAKEIEANGIELGEMIKLQQKKIEELTLHLIDKDKELQKERERINKLESTLKIISEKLIKDK